MTEIPVYGPDLRIGAPHAAPRAVFPAGGVSEGPPEHHPLPEDMGALVAGIHAHLGRIGESFDRSARAREAENQNVWSVDIDPMPMVLISGTFWVLDSPQLLSAGLGEHWDIHTISATGFTAGSVLGWVNLPQNAASAALGTAQQAALRAILSSAGIETFGKNQCHLRPQDRITFVGTGITLAPGNLAPLVSLGATRVADPFWGRYLI